MYEDVELDVTWIPRDRYLTLIQYTQYNRRIYSPGTKLILDFKQYQTRALKKVRDLTLQVLRDYEGMEEFRYGYLVALPGHKAGSVNAPCEWLCAELARAFPRRLVHLKQALRRVTDVEKSATAPPGRRPTSADHIQSIRYVGQQTNPNVRIIMVDDVLTRGETARACRAILRNATGCTDVRGLFVARTAN